MTDVEEKLQEDFGYIEQPDYKEVGYKHCCVVGKVGDYITFVLVKLLQNRETEDIVESVYNFELSDGQYLIEANPPAKKVHAESNGFIVPIWNGSKWIEGGTDEEIAKFNSEFPAPESPTPTKDEQLRADIDYIAAMTGVEL